MWCGSGWVEGGCGRGEVAAHIYENEADINWTPSTISTGNELHAIGVTTPTDRTDVATSSSTMEQIEWNLVHQGLPWVLPSFRRLDSARLGRPLSSILLFTASQRPLRAAKDEVRHRDERQDKHLRPDIRRPSPGLAWETRALPIPGVLVGGTSLCPFHLPTLQPTP